jgi:hypothetical protein
MPSDWVRRGKGTGRTVRLELGGDALELSQVSAADQARLIDLFVSRHVIGRASSERSADGPDHRE